MSKTNYNSFSKNTSTGETIIATTKIVTDKELEVIQNSAVYNSEISKKQNKSTGRIVKCELLNIREKPTIDSQVIDTVDLNSKLTINFEESTDEWFNVYVEDKSIDGFCMKKYVDVDK